jgi:hypothetical protein
MTFWHSPTGPCGAAARAWKPNLMQEELGMNTPFSPHAATRPRASTEKENMNAWTVGLAGGLLEGSPIRLAALAPRWSVQNG